MPGITTSVKREIIDDFVKEIKASIVPGQKPAKTVINFRTDRQDRIERDIVKVPVHLLKYRKDNGRISSDVMDYERKYSHLEENDEETQAILRKFLEDKDPEKTATLRNSILHSGQLDEAIITCDGFLINGNRRKMVMESLQNEFPNDEKYQFMKVVILPGEGDEGGPPTSIEIEKIENRYQLQRSGKSEYYGFDRALSIQKKISIGFSLEEQILDDPGFARASEKELKKAVKKMENDYLQPLKCVDRYLKQFRRSGEYKNISSGGSDREGRWQAFVDYSNTLQSTFKKPTKRLELNIAEDEVGIIEEAAFNLIRLRIIPDMPNKLHEIMRNLPKYCSTRDGKKEIIKIANEVEPVLPASECKDDDGNLLTPDEISEKWASKYKRPITYHIKKAVEEHTIKTHKGYGKNIISIRKRSK